MQSVDDAHAHAAFVIAFLRLYLLLAHSLLKPPACAFQQYLYPLLSQLTLCERRDVERDHRAGSSGAAHSREGVGCHARRGQVRVI
jgi:hypothetical protein